VDEFPKLKNPPIREAIIDINIQPFLVGDKSIFEPLREKMGSHFPIIEELNTLEQTIHFGTEGAVGEPKNYVRGLIFKSEDQKTIVQCRMDGFTLNRLSPYTDWDDVFPKAMSCWDVYRSVLKPQSVSRLVVRYINELTLTSTPSSLPEYLNIAPPLVPLDEGLDIFQFIYQQGVVLKNSEIQSNVTLAYEGNAHDGNPVIILDIDCSHMNSIISINIEELKPIFNKLRAVKNKIFFGSITDKTKELYL
jgi:uncharacterized protein (TIGR04255 family)